SRSVSATNQTTVVNNTAISVAPSADEHETELPRAPYCTVAGDKTPNTDSALAIVALVSEVADGPEQPAVQVAGPVMDTGGRDPQTIDSALKRRRYGFEADMKRHNAISE